MTLPDIYFAFDWRRGEQPLYFHRDPAGTVRSVRASELYPPQASLLIHGPGTPLWRAEDLDLLGRVRDGGGAVLPLGAVLSRCGLSPRVRREELLERLGAVHVDVDDPKWEGREILERLGEILEGLDGLDETPVDAAPGPRALVVADIMSAPDAPGVYTFLSADGNAIYVGKARSLRRRLASHFRMRSGEPAKRAALIAGATEIRWEETGSELEALLREHMALRREGPKINLQRAAHVRARGAWRNRAVALLLPSSAEGYSEVILVAGDGRFHAERVPRSSKLPRVFWGHLTAFLNGHTAGKGPGGEDLTRGEAEELAEIALSWIVRYGIHVNQIDLTHETTSLELKERVAAWLALDPSSERTEVR